MIDLTTNVLHAVTVGGGACLVARTVGSFYQSSVEADVVADGRKARCGGGEGGHELFVPHCCFGRSRRGFALVD